MAHIVLFAGGIDSRSLFDRYKEDLRIIGRAFLDRPAFQGASVTLLYGPGGTVTLNLGPRHQRVAAITASAANLEQALRDVSRDEADHFVFVASNHGDLNADRITTSLCCWDREFVEDHQFASWCSAINARRQIYVFGQCHSGGFIPPLARPDRCILTACAWDEYSWAHSSLSVDEFILFVTQGLRGGLATPTEIFSYARLRDSRPEHPQYYPGDVGNDTSFLG